jgi:hypothetical protein
MVARHTLFLVRRDLKILVGPMTADELKAGFRAMSFGLQDEVAGHCGPWISFEQLDSLVKYYPEVALIIRGESKNHWHEDTNAKGRLLKPAPAKPAKYRSSRRPEPRRSKLFWTIGVISLLISCALVGGFIIKNKEEALPLVADAHVLAVKDDPTEFLGWMDKSVGLIVSKSVRNKDLLQLWLPYLRMEAFFTTGSIEGFPSKLLKGSVPPWMPADCSVDSWRKKLQDGSLESFASAQKISRTPWAKMLAADPYWSRRRFTKGWLKPRNYMEACLMTASAAVRAEAESVTPSLPKELLIGMVQRMNTMASVTTRGQSSFTKDKWPLLSFLNCVDSSTTKTQLEACRAELPQSSDPQLLAVAEERLYWTALRLALPPFKIVSDPALVEAITKNREKFPSEDTLTKVDYAQELKVWQSYQQIQNMERAAQMVEQESQDVQFK